MNTEDQIDVIITSLKVLSLVQKNGRLCIRKGSLTIEPDDHLQRVRRWVYNDSRELTLMHIRNTILNATKITKGIINKQIDIELKNWTLQCLFTEMTNCQAGLINLKTTYNHDAIMVSSIDVLLERLKATCNELHVHLSSPILNV